MKGDWEEGRIEVEGERGEITSCPRCGSRIERKKLDIDFLDGKIKHELQQKSKDFLFTNLFY
jgi:hypothetical protein